MTPLLVSAFFDIGRGSWKYLTRSTEQYIGAYRAYVALLPAPRYLLATAATIDKVRDLVDYADISAADEIPSHFFLEPTRRVMARPEFKALFSEIDDRRHVEHIFPEYNVVVMAKWDALERAAALTKRRFSHYVWADFGLGRRGMEGAWLPAPSSFSPIERDRIVVSVARFPPLNPLTRETVIDRIRRFKEQTATSLMIVPAGLVEPFCALARRSYQMLLDMGLSNDDQVVVDMCVAQRPNFFHLSRARPGLTKFHHIHNIVHGLDKPWPWLLDNVGTAFVSRRWARRRIGL